jgi:asparagine synthase (glutamine-hydrolysing)
VVLTSNADLVRHHPAFTGGPSLEGIAGGLLTGGIVDGRSILNGVRRLGAGHVLRTTPGVEPDEVEQYVTPTSRRGFDEPVALTAERLDAVLRAAVRRHVRPARRHALLLSGGRDSRLLAGYLRDQRTDVEILTLGKPDDFEVVHSQAVARALGGTRTVADVPQEDYGRLALTHVRAEQTHGSLAGMHNWGVGDLLGPGSEAVVVGHLLELATGRPGLDGRELDALGEPGPAVWSFLRIRAVPLERLQRMARSTPLSRAIAGVVESIDRRSADFESPDEAINDHLLRRWDRAQSGAVLWRLSFRAWPVTPVLDPRVLEAGAACSRLPGRAVHDAIMRTYHPDLARAPLVHPSGAFDPLVPSVRWRGSEILRRCGIRLGLEPDGPQLHRRRYRRIYDLDNHGWRRVRAMAEPCRPALLEWLDEVELARYLPLATEPMTLASPIDEGYGRKTLLALMIWAGKKSSAPRGDPEALRTGP